MNNTGRLIRDHRDHVDMPLDKTYEDDISNNSARARIRTC